jgi:hypothetical protein
MPVALQKYDTVAEEINYLAFGGLLCHSDQEILNIQTNEAKHPRRYMERAKHDSGIGYLKEMPISVATKKYSKRYKR